MSVSNTELRVTVECVNRVFWLTRPKGRSDYHIIFRPPADVCAALGITSRVVKSTRHGVGFEPAARAEAQRIIRRYFPGQNGKVPAIEEQHEMTENRAFASLGEIADRYLAKARTVKNKEDIKLTTLQANVNCLAQIVEEQYDGNGKFLGRKTGTWRNQVFKTGAELAKRLHGFMTGRSLGARTEVARDRAKRSANSIVNMARSIFGKDYRGIYDGLRLPDGLEAIWLGDAKTFTKVDRDVKFQRIAPSVLASMQNEIVAMRQDKPDWYLAFWFARELGMRKDEIEQARRCWIEESPEGPELAIVKREYRDGSEYSPKGRDGRLLISPELLKDIQELSGAAKPSDKLVPITQRSMKAFSNWIADHLSKGPARLSVKTLHALRGQAISEVLEQLNGNVYKTLEFSRHQDIETLIKHYAANVGDRPMLGRTQLRVLPDPAKKVA